MWDSTRAFVHTYWVPKDEVVASRAGHGVPAALQFAGVFELVEPKLGLGADAVGLFAATEPSGVDPVTERVERSRLQQLTLHDLVD